MLRSIASAPVERMNEELDARCGMRERTLAIIKPDGVKARIIGEIIRRYEQAGLIPIAMRMTRISKQEAEDFYSVHRHRPFFDALTEFMSSGPILVMVLEGEGAIQRHRDLIGATNPVAAAAGTIRNAYGTSVDCNVVHGSDSSDTAAFEVGFFFPAMELSLFKEIKESCTQRRE